MNISSKWTEANKRNYQKHKEKIKAKSKAYQEQLKLNPDYFDIRLNQRLKTRYRIDLTEYRRLSSTQGDVCAVCKNTCTIKPRLSVDHCHETNKIRGLLCHKCNVGIGHFDNSVYLLEKAIAYLKGEK